MIADPDSVGITDSNPVGKEGPLRTVPSLRALRPTATNSSHFSPSRSRQHVPPLTSLAATLMDSPRKCCKHKAYGKAKSFRCNTYKKPGGRVLLSILERPARIGHEDSASYSSSFFSHSCALFCTHQKLNSFVLNLSLRIHFQHPSSGRIFPARWLCIVAPTAGTPHTGGSLHVQRFVRPHMVVFPAVGVQPSLQMPSRKTSAVQRPLQRPVKPLDFSLRLRMPYAAPAQPNPLTHQPQRQFGSTRRRLLAPPRRAVIHQHGFWDAAAIKRHFQLLPHKLTSSSRKHNSQLARTPVGITLSHCDYPLF